MRLHYFLQHQKDFGFFLWFSKVFSAEKKCLRRLQTLQRLRLGSRRASSSQHLASAREILIKFTQREMESLGEKWRVFTNWNKWAFFVESEEKGNAAAVKLWGSSKGTSGRVLFTVTQTVSLGKSDKKGQHRFILSAGEAPVPVHFLGLNAVQEDRMNAYSRYYFFSASEIKATANFIL